MKWETTVEVNPRDTDMFGVVHHSVYFCWVEQAFRRWVRSKPLRQGNHSFTVRDARIYNFRGIMPEDDVVTVRLWIDRIEVARFCMKIEFLVGGQRRAQGEYVFACVSIIGGQLSAALIPTSIREMLQELLVPASEIVAVRMPDLIPA